MRSFFKKYFDRENFKLALILSLMHFIMFNIPVFVYRILQIKPTIFVGIIELGKEILCNMLTLNIIFIGLTLHRFLLIPCALFLFICSAAATYYMVFFGIAPSFMMIEAIFATDTGEVYELFNPYIAGWVLFAGISCIYAIYKAKSSQVKGKVERLVSLLLLGIAIDNVVMPHQGFLLSSLPMQYLHNSYRYWCKNPESHSREDINAKFQFHDSSDEDVIAVLIIGESARYDHFSINGYHRETTPMLAEMGDDIISYKAESCATATHISVPCMLSRYSKKERNLVDSESSIASALSKLGFRSVLIGSQSVIKAYRNRNVSSFYDDMDFYLIPDGSTIIMHHDYDEKMVPYFIQQLNEPGKKFLILHSNGSHWHYAGRYHKDFEIFKPSLSKSKYKDAAISNTIELVNSYDNSILYTDFFITKIISLLKNKNAFVIYSSDHGELLGEGGKFGHGHEVEHPELVQVPFLIWFSDKFKAKNMEKWEYAKNRAKDAISHDYIFHTILDCLNIKSEAVDKSLSLCTKVQQINN